MGPSTKAIGIGERSVANRQSCSRSSPMPLLSRLVSAVLFFVSTILFKTLSNRCIVPSLVRLHPYRHSADNASVLLEMCADLQSRRGDLKLAELFAVVPAPHFDYYKHLA